MKRRNIFKLLAVIPFFRPSKRWGGRVRVHGEDVIPIIDYDHCHGSYTRYIKARRIGCSEMQFIEQLKQFNANIAQPVEHFVANEEVAGSTPVVRSISADVIQSGQNACLPSKTSHVRIVSSAPFTDEVPETAGYPGARINSRPLHFYWCS